MTLKMSRCRAIYKNIVIIIIIINTTITAFLTYLELPRAVKMTVCLIKRKIRNNLALLYLISFFNFCNIPSNDLNIYRCAFDAL